MALRGIAGDMARNSAGLWKAVAQAVDPKPPRDVPEPEVVVEATPAEPEPGQMMVPIDAWTRILEQVGHVHEAGQQLADARERAARAETENDFLKEQLRDLKAQKRTPRRPAAPAAEPTPSAAPIEPPADRTRLHRARQVASRWINPR